MPYLDLLDELLTQGLAGLGLAFRQAQLAYVLDRQQPDGGFGGRRGGSDCYYTEFALRLLVLLDGPAAACGAVARFFSSSPAPTALVDAFSVLNSRRLLAARDVALVVDEGACRRALALAGPTAYDTFVAALCRSLLGDALPDADDAMGALQQPDGGFAQQAGAEAQTNSTAAAVGFLMMANALTAEGSATAARYLAARQIGGGFAARDGAPPDLLSTFTALTSLMFLNALDGLDVAGLARFVRACAGPRGGFGALPGDETDLEYTYYGVGTLALLAAMLP